MRRITKPRATLAARSGAFMISLVMTASVAVISAPPVAAGLSVIGTAPAAQERLPTLEQLKKGRLTEQEAPKGYTFAMEMSYMAPNMMVLTKDPCADALASPTEGGPARAHASISFRKGDEGPTLSETVSAYGRKTARDMVNQYDKMINCPVSDEGNEKLIRLPLPKFGDASVGFTMFFGAEGAGKAQDSIRIPTVVVAYRDVSAMFTMTDGGERENVEFERFIEAGVNKLKKITSEKY